jgi:hypothetical protein
VTQAEEYVHLKTHLLEVLQTQRTTILVIVRNLKTNAEHVAQFVTRHFPMIQIQYDETGQPGIFIPTLYPYSREVTGQDAGAAFAILEGFL